MMPWKMEIPALKVAERLSTAGSQGLPAEVSRLDDDTAAVVVDMDGVDYILTLQVVPKQRPRSTSH